jgi:hypothetical protein
MDRFTTVTITTSAMEASISETPLTTRQQMALDAELRYRASDMQDSLAYMMLGIRPPAPSRAQLLLQRDNLKDRRQRVYQALLTLAQLNNMPTLIIPKGSSNPEDWTILPAEETPEETKARSQLADLTVELRKVLVQLAELQGMNPTETAMMLQREMAL